MFAVIKTGGKQYKVSSGDEISVEKLAAEPGETVQFNEVLMLGGDATSIGTPLIAGAGVQAEIVDQYRGDKIYNFKKRRRKHSSKRLKGHRQSLTSVRITEILTSGADGSGVKAALGAASAGAVAAATAPAAPTTSKPDAKADAPKATPEAKVDATPVAAEASKPGNLLDAAQGAADDLTRISGVGPKLLEKLNANGVYHFWQIAEWGPGEIAFMDDQLSFKGRIERDNWIEQATSFAAEAKGE
ncbi:MAG: 50S ribosomal protein L21 [Pseudomonadota bacterium]